MGTELLCARSSWWMGQVPQRGVEDALLDDLHGILHHLQRLRPNPLCVSGGGCGSTIHQRLLLPIAPSLLGRSSVPATSSSSTAPASTTPSPLPQASILQVG